MAFGSWATGALYGQTRDAPHVMRVRLIIVMRQDDTRERIMSLFDKLFGSRELRTAKGILKRVDAEVKATYGPLGKLGEAIVRAADGARRASAPALGFTLEGTPSEQQFLVMYELLYFFSHLSIRTAFATGFTEAQIGRLQGYLGPLLSSTAVGMFFRHWPEELKRKIRSEFYERLNDAEVEYAECRGLLSQENPFDKTTLLGRLASNIADLCAKPRDPTIMTAVVAEGSRSYTDMQLKKLIAAVHAVIDSVTDDLPADIPGA